MDLLFELTLGVGIGIAVGAFVAASGIAAVSFRFAVLGALVGAVIAGGFVGLALEDAFVVPAVGALVGSFVATGALGDLVAVARKRSGEAGGIVMWIGLFALIAIAAAMLFAPATLILLAALGWLWLSRRRRGSRKYKGLRSLT